VALPVHKPQRGWLTWWSSLPEKNGGWPERRSITNFKLSAAGEYLALIEPDGITIATEFAPLFPPQVADVSFGIALLASNTTFIASGAATARPRAD